MFNEAVNPPIEFEEDNISLESRHNPGREEVRYLVCMGDHLEPNDKRAHSNIGGWFGGLWVGPSETEGAPTLKRTNFMLLRGAISPLEQRAISKKADHRKPEGQVEDYLSGPKIPPNTRGYMVYPGDTIGYLQNDRFRPMGVVELTALRNIEWNTGLPKKIQLHFFPLWREWMASKEQVPQTIKEWEVFINDGINRSDSDVLTIIGSEMLESSRLYTTYCQNHIEKNRQLIMSVRSTDKGGFTIGWSNKSRLYASRLGVSLEEEDSLRPSSSGDMTGLLETMKADQKLRADELAAQKEQNRLLMIKIFGEEFVNEATKPEETAAPIEILPEFDPETMIHDVSLNEEPEENSEDTVSDEEVVEEVEQPQDTLSLMKEASPELTKRGRNRKRK